MPVIVSVRKPPLDVRFKRLGVEKVYLSTSRPVYIQVTGRFIKLKIRKVLEQQVKAKNRTYNFRRTSNLIGHPY